MRVKPIDLPKMVSIRKRSKVTPKATKKILGKSIEKRPECINDRSEFGHWEIDLMLGRKTKGEAVVMTLVERQTRFAIAVKLANKQAETINRAVKSLLSQYPIRSITSDNGSEFSSLSDLKVWKSIFPILMLLMKEEQMKISMVSWESFSQKVSLLTH